MTYTHEQSKTMYAALHAIATYDPTKLDAATLGNIAREALSQIDTGIGTDDDDPYGYDPADDDIG